MGVTGAGSWELVLGGEEKSPSKALGEQPCVHTCHTWTTTFVVAACSFFFWYKSSSTFVTIYKPSMFFTFCGLNFQELACCAAFVSCPVGRGSFRKA